MNPPDMNTSQLLLVSSLGLAVNLFGMFAMGGHHHVRILIRSTVCSSLNKHREVIHIVTLTVTRMVLRTTSQLVTNTPTAMIIQTTSYISETKTTLAPPALIHMVSKKSRSLVTTRIRMVEIVSSLACMITPTNSTPMVIPTHTSPPQITKTSIQRRVISGRGCSRTRGAKTLWSVAISSCVLAAAEGIHQSLPSSLESPITPNYRFGHDAHFEKSHMDGPAPNLHDHAHAHGHAHEGRSHNMRGVFLHVMAVRLLCFSSCDLNHKCITGYPGLYWCYCFDLAHTVLWMDGIRPYRISIYSSADRCKRHTPCHRHRKSAHA